MPLGVRVLTNHSNAGLAGLYAGGDLSGEASLGAGMRIARMARTQAGRLRGRSRKRPQERGGTVARGCHPSVEAVPPRR